MDSKLRFTFGHADSRLTQLKQASRNNRANTQTYRGTNKRAVELGTRIAGANFANIVPTPWRFDRRNSTNPLHAACSNSSPPRIPNAIFASRYYPLAIPKYVVALKKNFFIHSLLRACNPERKKRYRFAFPKWKFKLRVQKHAQALSRLISVVCLLLLKEPQQGYQNLSAVNSVRTIKPSYRDTSKPLSRLYVSSSSYTGWR